MADNVIFEDNSISVKNLIREKAIAFLYEVGAELVSRTQRNSRVDTGKTKSTGYGYEVEESKLAVHVGGKTDNTIWEEFGTGEHALLGNGRKTPWVYQDVKGNWHRTTGKKPNRPLMRAYESAKGAIQKRCRELMSELGNG